MTDSNATAQATRSPHHRFIFANSLGLRAGDNEFQLILSIEHGGGENIFLEEATVILTPKTAKLLWEILGQTIAQFEKDLGPIPMPPSVANMKLQKVEKSKP